MCKKNIVFFLSVVLLPYLYHCEALCQGTLGEVQSLFYTRNSSVYFMWNPPVGWENCSELVYEIQWKDSDSNGIFFTDTTTQTQYTFHYAAANFLCQVFGVSLIAKYNDVVGEIRDTIVVADNFTSLNVDPVENLEIQQLGNYMLVRWDPPSNFRACWGLHYVVEVFDQNTSVTTWQEQRTFYSFNYQAENLCNSELLVRVTARFRSLSTAPVTRLFLTGFC